MLYFILGFIIGFIVRSIINIKRKKIEDYNVDLYDNWYPVDN